MDIVQEFLSRLPLKRKTTGGGWISVNSPCCAYRGHKPDKRGRGGFVMTPEGGWTWNCFNCNFQTGWSPGQTLSGKAKQLLKYLGVSEDEITKINFNALRQKQNAGLVKQNNKFVSNEIISLPDGSKPFSYWAENPTEDFLNVLRYMVEKRNPDIIKWHEYYWSPDVKNDLNKRVIVPFTSEHSNYIYGFSARAIDAKIDPKYYAKYKRGYLFGQENLLKPLRKMIILSEGIFDAIALSGCACMKQTMSDEQINTLKMSDKTVIVLPDKDQSGKGLVEQALEHNFMVSMPDWPNSAIKDGDDAVKIYGRIPAIKKIIDSATNNKLKIAYQIRTWFKE